MTWILRIFYILTQCLTAFSVGEIATHAMEYDLTKSMLIRNAALLLVCVFIYYVLERIDRRLADNKRNTGVTAAVFDLMFYTVVTVMAVVVIEVYFNYSLPKQVVITVLSLFMIMLAGRRIWNGDGAEGRRIPEGKGVVYIILTVIRYLAGIGLGMLVLITFRKEDDRLYFYLAMAGCAALAVVPGIMTQGREAGGKNIEKDEEKADGRYAENTDTGDFDSWEYWEKLEREELERRRDRKIRGIRFGVITVAVTTFLFFISPIAASVYLLSAFLVGVLLPMLIYRFATGGSEAVAVKSRLAGSVSCRIFQVILLLLAVWQLSYGAIWEYEFLMMLGVIIVTEEYLLS